MELEALLFPHTYLRLDLAHLLLSVFDKIYLLQPTEAKPEGAFEELISKGIVIPLAPPPLKGKLIWFKRLIASYEEWGNMMRWPENVSLFKARPEVLEETVAEIKAAILGKDQKKEDPVFKARVILQLAQNLDRRLEELDFEYKFLKEQADRLSNFILGNDPTVKRSQNWITMGIEPSWELANLHERVLAAARLLLLTELPTNILVTDQLEIIETCLDLFPETQNLGKCTLKPFESIENQEERSLIQEKIKRIFQNIPLREEEAPALEIWKLPTGLKNLFESLLGKKSPKREGFSFLCHLWHV